MRGITVIGKVIEAIEQANTSGLYVEVGSDILSGFSGNKLVGSLQRLAHLHSENSDACYLEVGVFQGLTLLSVAKSCPNIMCYGIDNFAYFDPDGKNLSLVEERSEKLAISNKVIINQDYEDALESLKSLIGEKKVGVYFIDGPHDYRSQLICLELILSNLHEEGIIVIDDCNYNHVRQANRDFLVTHPEFKLVFEAYTKCHPQNMTDSEKLDAKLGWWNGVNIIARDTENCLSPMYPPTERSRLLYENDHIIHASRAAESIPLMARIANSFYGGNYLNLIKSLGKFLQEYPQNSGKYKQRFDNTNTYSDDLPSSNFNKKLK